MSLSRWPAASVAHYPGPGCPNSSIDHAWKWKVASTQVNKHYCKSTTSEAHISIKAHRHRSTCSLKIGKRSPHGHSLLQFHKRKPHGHKGASPQVNKHLANRQANPTWPLLSAWLIQMSLLHCCSRYAYIHIYIHVCIYNYIHIYMSIYTGASPQVNKNLANRQGKPTWPLLSAWLKTNVIVALLLSLCIHAYIYTCVYI